VYPIISLPTLTSVIKTVCSNLSFVLPRRSLNDLILLLTKSCLRKKERKKKAKKIEYGKKKNKIKSKMLFVCWKKENSGVCVFFFQQ